LRRGERKKGREKNRFPVLGSARSSFWLIERKERKRKKGGRKGGRKEKAPGVKSLRRHEVLRNPLEGREGKEEGGGREERKRKIGLALIRFSSSEEERYK